MLVLWLLCWAHCSLSRFGAVQGSAAYTCCLATNEHAEETHEHEGHHSNDAPLHTGLDCGVCDFLTHGSTLMQKLPPMTALAVEAPPLATWEPAPLPELATTFLTSLAANDPPPLRALCEVLSRTACPVRGPTQA
ncbi:DUF2946 family protein [Prosthecobacter sp.]|uniref:DUF2946 family protein n=1 Tax=Prosthecobacter sp. TaxID=1965333 RepID=UPI002486F4E4|nr:DUF2946 family protein [Prosthecobacter sp.]MDI1312234.1 DUF2946 family protein [Prosthecobacter sp.]